MFREEVYLLILLLFTYFVRSGSNIPFTVGRKMGKCLEMIVQHYLFDG